MGVDLQDPDRPVIRKAGEEGNGHGIVAAEQDRYSRQGPLIESYLELSR